jgi:hypothetical protein
MIQYSIAHRWNSTTISSTIIALLLLQFTHHLHLLHQPLSTIMKWNIVVQQKLATEWQAMYVQLRTVQPNIASLVKVITIAQHLYVRRLIHHNSIVTLPYSSTFPILTTATLSLLHPEFPQPIIMRSTAHRQNHTTIKWVSYAHYLPRLTLTLSSLIPIITAAVMVQRNIATFFRKSTTLLHFIVRIKMMTILTLHLKGQCRSLQ